MKKILLLSFAAVLMCSATAFAQTPNPNTGTTNGKAAKIIAKQNRQELVQLKAEWKSLSPEQRKARKSEFKKRREELKTKASNLTPGQRAAIKEKRKEQQGQTTRPVRPTKPERPVRKGV